MVQSTARVMALLEILQSGGTRTVAELATRLEVDKRTVRRYVENLRELDIPVDSVRGRYGGYRLARHFRMPPLMLTDEEALAVVWALLAARASGSSPASPTAVDAALGKLRRVLPNALAGRIDAVLETTEFTSAVHGSKARAADVEQDAAALVLELAEAARDLQVVTFDYTTGRGQQERREVHPHGVVAHEGRLYLAAHDVARAAARTFRLDRMANLARTGGTFDPPTTPQSTVRRVTGPLPPDPTRHDVSFLVQADPADVRQFFPELLASVDPVATSDVDDTWVRVVVRAERLDWVAQRLAAVDRPFHVERPPELRDVLGGLAHRLLGAASTSDATDDERGLG
ncbi:helix-turn-helix transcriptional regulator [Jatrophihabitans sp. YIM 134969]